MSDVFATENEPGLQSREEGGGGPSAGQGDTLERQREGKGSLVMNKNRNDGVVLSLIL